MVPQKNEADLKVASLDKEEFHRAHSSGRYVSVILFVSLIKSGKPGTGSGLPGVLYLSIAKTRSGWSQET